MADMFEEYRKQQETTPKKPQAAQPPIQQAIQDKSPYGITLRTTQGLACEILHSDSNAMLRVQLKAGESCKAESGAMVAMSNTIDVEGKLEGGLLGGLGRMFSGENVFFQTLKANRGAGTVLLSPTMPGDLAIIELEGKTGYLVQKGGFFVGSQSLNIETTSQSLSKGLFSGEGFFILKASGKGTLVVSSYGAIHLLDIPAGEEMIIDNEHLVAWTENANYQVEKAAGGWISSLTSGEGLVLRFRGPAKVFIQTRNPSGFKAWIRQSLAK